MEAGTTGKERTFLQKATKYLVVGLQNIHFVAFCGKVRNFLQHSCTLENTLEFVKSCSGTEFRHVSTGFAARGLSIFEFL